MDILHIDDSPEICKLYSDMFATSNHSITSVTDGKKGLELVSKKKYDLILLDMCMPKYSGMEFLRDLKIKMASELKKVIIVSVLQINEQQTQGFLKLGIKSVLEKPVKIQKFEGIIQNMPQIKN